MFADDRDAMRERYASAWAKVSSGQPVTPLEAMIGEVVGWHPEYHTLLEGDRDARLRDYTPEDGETNPFLHMGLHLGLREQLSTDRPAGIRALHQALCTRLGDAHAAEHQMMEALAEALWDAQRQGRAPDEAAYLERLRRLAGGPLA